MTAETMRNLCSTRNEHFFLGWLIIDLKGILKEVMYVEVYSIDKLHALISNDRV
ncbi:hypothetical protein [Jeotgalibacillus marinus]|uniref:Uncharacterized protein n=1 Tax=Jeotgalibacillus marinus TaxID=86667 RepID=A0ABV3PYZ5_9BACL